MVADSPDWSSNVQVTGTSVTFNMIFTGQSIAVFSGSQFNASAGNGVYVNGGALVGAGVAVICTYSVPAGKTFFCQGISFVALTAVGTPTTQFQLALGFAIVLWGGAPVGNFLIFDTPVLFAAGGTVNLFCGQFSNPQVNNTVLGSFWGWIG